MNIRQKVERLSTIRALIREEIFSDCADTDITEQIIAQYVLAFCMMELTTDPVNVVKVET